MSDFYWRGVRTPQTRPLCTPRAATNMPHNMYIGARNTTRLLFKTAVSAVFTCIGALGTPQPNGAPR